jgi:tetratricopeptide (TPR) repeat protein
MSFAQRFGQAAAMIAAVCWWQASLRAQDAGGSAGGRDPDAVAAVEAAAKLLGEEKYKEAVVEANKALKIDPTFPEAYIVKGEVLKKTEDYQGAAKAFSDALNFAPDAVAAYNGRGEAYMEVGQIDVAIDDFRKAQERDPNNPVVLSNLGHLLVNNAGDATNGLRILTDAIALNDKDARAYRDRGLAHAQLSEFDESIADMKKAAEIEPDNYENYQMMAAIYQLQENYGPSIDALTKAIETYKPKKRTDPETFINGYIMRSDAYMREGEKATDPAQREAAFEAAIADADAVLAVNDDKYPEAGVAYFRRGRALRMLERYSNAIDSFTRAIQNIPAGEDAGYAPEALMYRGICWFYIGSNDLARSDFEKASSTGSGYQDPRVFLWIGFTHHAEGDYRDAIDSYSEAIAKNDRFALAYVNRGRAYYDLGEYRKAIENFNSAISVEPMDAEHYYKSGLAYMKEEEFERAAYFFDMALKKDNASPKMYRAMVSALRQLGRNELADEYEKKAG